MQRLSLVQCVERVQDRDLTANDAPARALPRPRTEVAVLPYSIAR
jgi:hypothetical protein